ncbi:MAG: hypothetical protein OEY01_03450 [Desulfobulbaceae bacterium]|nr:hypothetical protein [Desulfobulbaceae bacterium]
MTYFIVDKDLIDDGLLNGRTYGGEQAPEGVEPTRFRLYDDDNILYFEGRAWLRPDDSGFEMQDSLGYSYGCTSTKLLEKGKWNIL